jgi:hypothetical protein
MYSRKHIATAVSPANGLGVRALLAWLDSVQFGTADRVSGGYTHFMPSENTKTLLFVAWAIAVCLSAIAIGIASVPHWIVVASVAVVPPLVARSFWHVPEQTISESIHDARR